MSAKREKIPIIYILLMDVIFHYTRNIANTVPIFKLLFNSLIINEN
ncbi:hypothetical protein PROVRUST_05151 [Providencia rustigianii DSM 4541]|uniref:Uncharacterized protein n=1 Tax=Providencia rustigianii DSM 4541 TaxID=500637 RepID=D1NY31_9GAMM|nr:hypothetical protein PROVRUST_05151 [Providencia rustigianii DSM 4541]